jgi:CHAT domain-containing protein
LIACTGGRTQVGAGGDVKGLVPALLYAGASSTVSTLWRISDRDGAAFSTAFFESLSEVTVDNKNGDKVGRPFDLAKAVQKAVVAMNPNADQPLISWAAYVLHGYWMLPDGWNEER